MAQVLALVPSAGLDAVLVAVELALETGPPSGRVSDRARDQRAGAPERARRGRPTSQTLLQVLTPPMADTARYDRLRDIRGGRS